MLPEAGADVDARDKEGRRSRTPLSYVVSTPTFRGYDSYRAWPLLKWGADKNSKGNKGRSSVGLALKEFKWPTDEELANWELTDEELHN